MVIHCILTGLLVYYIALWLWYRYTDSRTSPGRTDDAPLPRNGVSGYTLIGESRSKGRQIGTAQDKSGHLPQATENDTIFAPQADVQPEENISEAAAEAEETPGYENDEPDYEDEEIAGYMDGDDDTGRATGASMNWAKRYARRTPTTPPKRRNGKPPGHWQALRGRTSTMRWWRTSTAGWQRWRNCWGATKRNWLRLLSLPKLAIQARNTKRST